MRKLIILTFWSMAAPLCGQTAESTYVVPDGLVRGGAFIDCFLPVPLRGPLRSDVWGADNVIPRDVDNGIEEAFPAPGSESGRRFFSYQRNALNFLEDMRRWGQFTASVEAMGSVA
jgi:hypothetical protein